MVEYYKGIRIVKKEKSILVNGQPLWFQREPSDADIRTIKMIIDFGAQYARRSLKESWKDFLRAMEEV